MRRALRWGVRIVAALLLLPLPLLGVVVLALNVKAGRALAERLVGQFTGGQVTIAGLSGRFPDRIRLERIEIRDSRGVWLTVQGAALDWSPLALLGGDAAIARLSAVRVAAQRLPATEGEASKPSGSGNAFHLPVRVDVASLHVDRIELAAEVAGATAVLSADGSAHVVSLQDGRADVALRRLEGEGAYNVHGAIDSSRLSATLDAEEPPGGLFAEIGKLPALGGIHVAAKLDGPWTGAETHLSVAAGPLRVKADGTINVEGESADLDLVATAPAMSPRPDLSWQSVALDAHVRGKLSAPQATGHLRLDGLAAAGAGVRQFAADVRGDKGEVTVTARADGVRLPGPRPDILAAAPVKLDAHVQLNAADRPVTFSVSHPLVSIRGDARTEGAASARAHLEAPDLAPLAAVGGMDLQGHAALDLTAALGEAISATLDGTLAVTGGLPPLPGLLGSGAHIDAAGSMRGDDIVLSRLNVQGSALQLVVQGGLRDTLADISWTLGLPNLSVIAAGIQGAVHAQGRVRGKADNLSAQADASGEVGAPGVPRGPIKLSLTAANLPGAPTGHVSAEGTLDGAALALDATAARQTDGATRLDIARASWKSASAEGALTLAKGAVLPEGRLSLRMTRLEDLRRLIGQKLAGAVEASLDLSSAAGTPRARLTMDARGAGLVGAVQVGRATLTATVADPLGARDIDAVLAASGIQASGIGGSARVTAKGRQDAVALALQTDLTGVAGAPLAARAGGTLDTTGRSLRLASLQADWKGETLRLLAPVRASFADGVSVDRLRLGLGEAVLQMAGRASPTLDLTASLTGVTPALARGFLPDLQVDGALNAEAKLTGTPQRPAGTLRLAATGLHLRAGPGAALPPAGLRVEATLAGESARIAGRASAGRNEITLDGTAPLGGAGAMDLRTRGGVDLALLDPILLAQGRRVRGQVALDATITGTPTAPRANGLLRLSGGEINDYAQGAHLSDITALIEAQGDTVRISRFTAQAGKGSIRASGAVGLGGARPVDLRLAAHNATPLASDRITATLDMDLALRGEIEGALGLSGDIKIDRADIGIPDKLPAKVAVLKVARPGAPPPAAAGSVPDIGLDVRLTAPQQVFVRGRGLFAELRGDIHVTGDAAHPRTDGTFKLRRGEFNLAGVALTFSSGEVGFSGGGSIDPTLNFVANSTNGSIVATLTVTGTASAPKIALSSTPELPQDEVLAQLLFHQSAATLSAVQLASAAAALAQISGASGTFDPLNSVRQGLGLDRLSVGGGQNGNGASLEAGRYVARGVYLGAKQGTSGQGTQASLQIDLLKGLKLETNVGTGGATTATGASSATDAGGTSVGLTYQFNY